MVDGVWCEDPKVIKAKMARYYKNSFTEGVATCLILCCNRIEKISVDDAILLEKPFDEKEVWKAIRGCEEDKELGPDDFNFKFILKLWRVIIGLFPFLLHVRRLLQSLCHALFLGSSSANSNSSVFSYKSFSVLKPLNVHSGSPLMCSLMYSFQSHVLFFLNFTSLLTHILCVVGLISRDKVMAISVILVSSESSEDSVRTPAGRVILYLTILSSKDDTTDSDTPDTPPSPTHGTPFTKITASTQRLPVIPRCRVMILAPGHPIPHDSSSDSSSRHSLSDHFSPDLSSTSAEPSCKRHRSLMTNVHALPPVSGALSPVRADLIPSSKRVKDSGYLDINPKVQAEIDECLAYTYALRDRGIDARVVVETVDRDEIETGVREVMYETLGDLVQRFHDHTQAILVHRVQVIEGVQTEQRRRIIEVESAVTALTERVAELKRDNRRLRGTASVES
nr:hypothetical protein [Tanacetum cinerariifolium]